MKFLFENWRSFINEDISKLSDAEKSQLGTPKVLRTGKQSRYNYATEQEWGQLRDILVQRSQDSNPQLEPELTAYTPGETLKLFSHPKIKKWHDSIASFQIPEEYGTVIFVPCAKTKPWACATRGIYKSYNQIINMVKAGEIDPVYFVTISEPLGIVPQDKWGDFPQYDNPGLFRDDAQRSGLFTRDWAKYGFDTKLIVPFDDRAYEQAITRLSEIISKFLETNKDKRFLAFVKDFQGLSTHTHMLNKAQEKTGIDIERHFKREKPRTPPAPYILSKIDEAVNKKIIVPTKKDLIDMILMDPKQTISIDGPKGSTKMFGGDTPHVLPFDYGEYPMLVNPADGMGWDVILMPGVSSKDASLFPVGHVPYNKKFLDLKGGSKFGNDKMILSRNGDYDEEAKNMLDEFFSAIKQFDKIVWY